MSVPISTVGPSPGNDPGQLGPKSDRVAHPPFDQLVGNAFGLHPLKYSGTRRRRADDQSSAVRRIPLSSHVTGPLEPFYDSAHRLLLDPIRRRELALGQRAVPQGVERQ